MTPRPGLDRWSDDQGQSADIEIHARETLARRAQLDELYATHTGQTAARIHSDSDRDAS